MIVRTPLAKKRRPDESSDSPNPHSGQFVIFEDLPVPVSKPEHHQHSSDQMLCTYQCRQLVKADFMDALSSAEKKAHDYQSKVETMDDDLRKSGRMSFILALFTNFTAFIHSKETERMKFRDQILYAEQQLAAAKGREEALQDQLLKEVNESQERLKKQIHIHSELETAPKCITLYRTCLPSGIWISLGYHRNHGGEGFSRDAEGLHSSTLRTSPLRCHSHVEFTLYDSELCSTATRHNGSGRVREG
ncbi:mitotic spindle checkpoint protein MAD1 [Tanacetum coccineum]